MAHKQSMRQVPVSPACRPSAGTAAISEHMKNDMGKSMEPINMKRCIPGILLLLAFSLAGCGGSGSTRVAATTVPGTPALPAIANSYYISPNGDDGGSCSAVAPCKTFEKAVSMLAAGDELVLKDGYYSLSENGTLSLEDDNYNPIPLSGQMPSGIDAGNPTIVRAENPGQVSIEGNLRLGLKGGKVQHIIVYGLTFHASGSIYNGDYLTIKDSGFEGGFNIGTNDHDEGNSYNLVEDVWIWGENVRNMGINYRSHHNTWRRVLIRGDGCDDPWCGEKADNFSPGISIYNSHHTVLENVIVIDRVLGANTLGGYADFITAQHDSSNPPQPEGELLGRNSWLGCMSINSEDPAMVFEADSVETGTTTATIKEFVTLNSGNGIFLDPAHRPFDGISVFDVNNLYVYPKNGTIDSFSIGCDVVQAGDPGCAVHIIGVTYAGLYTGNMSGNIPQNRYDTSTPLWPWPNEERIKTEMCQSASRGFCGFAGTISQYVMSY